MRTFQEIADVDSFGHVFQGKSRYFLCCPIDVNWRRNQIFVKESPCCLVRAYKQLSGCVVNTYHRASPSQSRLPVIFGYNAIL